MIVPFTYDYAAPFSEGLAYVCKGGGIVDPWYRDSDEYGKFGYINKTGEVVVPLVYDCEYSDCGGILLAQSFCGGYATVSKRTVIPESESYYMDYGMIDNTGMITVPLDYDWIWHDGGYWNFDNELVLVGLSDDHAGYYSWDSCGLVDTMGKEVVAIGHYTSIEPFCEGYAKVWYDASRSNYGSPIFGTGTYGFVDTAGREVVPCIFSNVRSFSEGLAAVLVDEKWGYIAIVEP